MVLSEFTTSTFNARHPLNQIISFVLTLIFHIHIIAEIHAERVAHDGTEARVEYKQREITCAIKDL